MCCANNLFHILHLNAYSESSDNTCFVREVIFGVAKTKVARQFVSVRTRNNGGATVGCGVVAGF